MELIAWQSPVHECLCELVNAGLCYKMLKIVTKASRFYLVHAVCMQPPFVCFNYKQAQKTLKSAALNKPVLKKKDMQDPRGPRHNNALPHQISH